MALRELQLAPLDKQQALRVIARRYAQQIVDGELEPYYGATLILDELDEYEPFAEMSFAELAHQIDDYQPRCCRPASQPARILKACDGVAFVGGARGA